MLTLHKLKIVAIVLYLFNVVNSQPLKIYNPNTLPDSEQDWFLCGMPERSFLCDPNNLLNPMKDFTSGFLFILIV